MTRGVLSRAAFDDLVARAVHDRAARAVLGDALEECGFWEGATIGSDGSGKVSLADTLAKPDFQMLHALLCVDPHRAFATLSRIREEGWAELTSVVVDVLLEVVDDLVAPEELRTAAPFDLHPGWRTLLEDARAHRSTDLARDMQELIDALDWIDGKRPATLPLVELGAWEDFGEPLLFAGIADDPAVAHVPGLVRAAHQWGGHSCHGIDLLGLFVEPPVAIVDVLAPRLIEMNDDAWISQIDAADLALFARASAPLGRPTFVGGGEAFVYTDDATFDGLRGLPVVRFRAAGKPWKDLWHQATRFHDGVIGDAELAALAELQRHSGRRPFLAWVWGNSD